MDKITWSPDVEANFKRILGKIPVFLRPIARKNVSKKAGELVLAGQRYVVEEKDLVDAFFAETPFGFHGPLKCDMEEFGIDYKKYGYE